MTLSATADEHLALPPINTHLIKSKHVHETFKIQVMQPTQIKGDNQPMPVVYATDGNRNFDMLKSLSAIIQTCKDDAPPFILVSIGYEGDSPYAGRLLRARDFTFPPYPKVDVKSIPPIYEGELIAEQGTTDFYGAEDFRRFISEELIPFIDEQYETVPGERTYFGHSGGGFFGLFTLFTEPELFKNYIVSSPGLLFHGEGPGTEVHDNCDCGAQMAREFIASGKSLCGIKLYMSAGADEQFEKGLGPWQMVSGLYQVAKIMKNAAIPGLELMTEVFPGETHSTAYPIAFIHGVQAAFGTRRVSRSVYF